MSVQDFSITFALDICSIHTWRNKLMYDNVAVALVQQRILTSWKHCPLPFGFRVLRLMDLLIILSKEEQFHVEYLMLRVTCQLL